ncbi:MAG: replicative DNA helicase [Chlamydiia bacterium]
MSENKPRQPPFSRESEMMVLGCMLTSGPGLNAGADALKEEDFYLPEHRTLFHSLQHAYRQDKPVDLHLIAEELRRTNKLAEVGGVPYLTNLAQFVGTSAYIEEYCGIVRDKALLRRMVQAAQEIEKKALEEPEDVSGALDDAQQKLFSISQSARTELGVSIAELLTGTRSYSQKPFLEEVETRQEQFRARGGKDLGITGLPTFFTDLDRMIDGLGRSNLLILAARPAMGKTAFALNIAENICFKHGQAVGIFSLEMTSEQLLHRLICSQAEVESDKVKTGALSGQEYQRIVGAVNQMSQYTMIIDDQPGLKITDLRARARRMREAFGIELLIIDYLQLLTGSGTNRTSENRQNEISEISRMLKTLARELNIPVICLSQLSRKVEDRNQHKPMLSDLRESGCLGPESVIECADGSLHTIKNLAAEGELALEVWALDAQGKLIQAVMTKAFSSGLKPLFAIRAGGRLLRASANHPFWTREGWKPLEHLSPGEEVALRDGDQVIWAVIDSLLPDGHEEVYDATVPGAHSFVANGFIVHNSIEQDADVVVFLLRRDYYDPLDKPGMAEIIVAKNRHGSVGSVHLTFRKEIGQFANYTPLKQQVSVGTESGGANSFSSFEASLQP